MLQRVFDLVTYKVYAELKAEAQRSYLGLVWWVAEPIIFMLIFYFVFDVLFQRAVEHYIQFLLIGLTTWHWMQATIVQCGSSISTNRPIIQQVLVPKAVFPVVIVLTNLVKFSIVLAILMVFIIWYGIPITWSWLYCLPVLFVSILFVSGTGFLLGAIFPLVPDLRILVENSFRGIFFLSGIFYEVSSLAPKVAELLSYNPFLVLISAMRKALMDGEAPPLPAMITISILSLACLLLGLLAMRKLRSTYAKALI